MDNFEVRNSALLGELFRPRGDPRHALGLRIAEYKEVLAGAWYGLHPREGIVGLVKAFDHLAHHQGHRHSLEIAFTASAHLTHGKTLFVHRGDRAADARIADAHPGIPILGLEDSHHRGALKPDAGHVIQDAPVVETPINR